MLFMFIDHFTGYPEGNNSLLVVFCVHIKLTSKNFDDSLTDGESEQG